MKKIVLLLLVIIFFSAILRLSYYDISPPALFTDEANQGYNAYLLSQTGRDEHGVFLPISLRSFGDWKPPMQTYLAVPFIRFFGLSELDIRLPSIILGIGSILVAFTLLKELGFTNRVGLLTAFFLAISPWHLHQSRSAMLVMVALFFFLLGFLHFVKALHKKKYVLLSAISFSFCIYSYYGTRLIVPLFLFFLFLWYRKLTKKFFSFLFSFILIFSLFLIPLGIAFVRQPDVVFGRAKTISVFYDRGTELRIWELTAQDGPGRVLTARFFHNKLYLYLIDITRRLFSHLDSQFLYRQGDIAPPFWIPNMGVLYTIDAVFLFLGIYLLLKEKREQAVILVLFLILALIPASLTFMTPSANRTFSAIFPLIFFVSYSVLRLTQTFRSHNRNLSFVIIGMVTLAYVFNFRGYLIQYYKILPTHFSDQWAYGFKQMVQYVQNVEDQYDHIVILPHSNIAYIYFLFYAKNLAQASAIALTRDYRPDQYGFEHVSQMGKYQFLRSGSLVDVRSRYNGRTLYVGTKDEIPNSMRKPIVMYPEERPAFVFSE